MQKIQIPFQLPSQGKLYDNFDGNVTLSPIRGSQEELLAGAGEGVNQTVILRQVTEQLINLPASFRFSDLLQTDWAACLIQILSISYSPNIPLSLKCPSCRNQFRKEMKFSDLDLKFADSFGDDYREPFSTRPLPLSKDIIEFKLARIKTAQAVEDCVARQRKMGGKGVATNYALAIQIHSVNGVPTKTNDALQWVIDAIAGDLNALRAEIEEKETGYDLAPKFTCPHCSHEFATQMPIDGSFFRGNVSS